MPRLSSVPPPPVGVRERAEYEGALVRQARELRLINEVGRIAAHGLELRPMLQRITDALARGLKIEFVACITIDRDADRFECQALTSCVPTKVYVGYGRPLGSGVVGEVAATGRAIVIDDAREHHNWVDTLPGALSEICVPVRYADEIVAIINLESRIRAAFHDHLPLMETIADQVAGAIANARLYASLVEANRTLTDLFSRYVAPDLARTLLEQPDRLAVRAERRDVSVLFADLRGFSGLAQRLDSERVLDLLNAWYTAVADCVFAERGSIHRFLGDGLFAVFGVPELLEDHADRAVAAARAMRSRIAAMDASWRDVAGEPLRAAIAINSGEVVAGSLGDPRHMEYSVIGDPVNVAARLEAEAKARGLSVVLSGATHDALDRKDSVLALGEVALRGREGSVRIYTIE